MARLDALSMLQENGSDELLLNELNNKVIVGFSAKEVSMKLKNPENQNQIHEHHSEIL
jgi:hypothetical protein